MVSRILVAVDGSSHSYKVVDAAVKLAKRFDAKIYLMHVVQKMEAPAEFAQYVTVEKIDADPDFYYRKMVGEVILDKLGDRVVSEGVKMEKVLEFGDPADRILEAAENLQPDYIVVGVIGLRGIRRFAALGSVVRRVIENSKFPVVAIP